MSNQWFRWYRDTASDPKFKMVARQAEDFAGAEGPITARDAIACWVALLERVDSNGIVTVVTALRNADDALTAYLSASLDINEMTAQAIIEAMVDHGLLLKNGHYHVPNWQKRQYLDATNAQRQARFRERRNNGKRNGPVTASNGRVTQPETETETETERKKEAPANAVASPNGFQGKVVRLSAKDFASWQDAYRRLDLRAELTARDEWLAEQPPAIRQRWFQSTSKYLANRNMEARAKGEVATAPRLSRTQQATVEILEEIQNGSFGLGLCDENSEPSVIQFPKSSARRQDVPKAIGDCIDGTAEIITESFGRSTDGLPCDCEVSDHS